jgi:hypothetical protein
MTDRLDELKDTAARLDAAVEEFISSWGDLPDEVLRFRPLADAWSIKEVIGHLIDSASNNHQRFVRLQIEDRLHFPNYGKFNSDWVRIQAYQSADWTALLDVWRHMNRHLAWIMRHADEACLDHVWLMDDTTPVSLFYMMTDYLAHLKTHLNQIDGLRSKQQKEK